MGKRTPAAPRGEAEPAPSEPVAVRRRTEGERREGLRGEVRREEREVVMSGGSAAQVRAGSKNKPRRRSMMVRTAA